MTTPSDLSSCLFNSAAAAAGVSSSLARLSLVLCLFLSLQKLFQPKTGSPDSGWIVLTLLVLYVGGAGDPALFTLM